MAKTERWLITPYFKGCGLLWETLLKRAASLNVAYFLVIDEKDPANTTPAIGFYQESHLKLFTELAPAIEITPTFDCTCEQYTKSDNPYEDEEKPIGTRTLHYYKVLPTLLSKRQRMDSPSSNLEENIA